MNEKEGYKPKNNVKMITNQVDTLQLLETETKKVQALKIRMK